MNFVENLKNELGNELTSTENGALVYKTTGFELLDMNFMVSSLRGKTEEYICNKYAKVYAENPKYAVKWLFYARDVRGGLGERRLFRYCMNWLCSYHQDVAIAVLPVISEYGRWDDLVYLLNNSNSEVVKTVINILSKQLANDIANLAINKPISLLAKWMPSINTSSTETKALAKKFIKTIKVTEKEYRVILSALRKHLRVIETYMCKNEWDKINYEAVPSRANLIYSKAFFRNDRERRLEFLESVKKGEAKINGATNFPHDIVNKYKYINGVDDSLELVWKALPNYVKDNSTTLCVVDGSGSMGCHIPNTKITCHDVANSLGIYFAERCAGAFKDTFITFSTHPQLVKLKNCKTLKDKLTTVQSYCECADTNIEAVFDLILRAAIANKMNQSDMPDNILILSDMEFNSCACSYHGRGIKKSLFEVIEKKFAAAGYKLPRLVFWNIWSRTCGVPIRNNECGVALVSGFSPAIVEMVLSNETDPYQCLIKQLDKPRYDEVERCLLC